jgi:formylglycine-generating enzyme required for sulfatase activity
MAGAAGACGACGPLEECGAGDFCVARSVTVAPGVTIDATETTRAQYAVWLATSPPTSGQDPDACSSNKSFEPIASCMGLAGVCATGCEQHPQVCVDACDAMAYCKAAGKRLCGRIGGGTIPSTANHESQWYAACSSGGTHNYPYGGDPATGPTDGYDGGACNSVDKGLGTTMPVGSNPGCSSTEEGFAGVFDLSGNVNEWEDRYTKIGGTAQFRMRGGSYASNASNSRCDVILLATGVAQGQVGFRCCGP